jgi:hypothetical protein
MYAGKMPSGCVFFWASKKARSIPRPFLPGQFQEKIRERIRKDRFLAIHGESDHRGLHLRVCRLVEPFQLIAL